MRSSQHLCSSTYFNGMNPWPNLSLHRFLVWFTRNKYPSIIHKVDMCYSDTFSLFTHFSSDLKHAIVRWLTNPNCARSHLPHYVQSSYEHFIHLSKWTLPCSFSCHIYILAILLIVEAKTRNIYDYIVHSHLNTSLYGVHS